MPAPELDRTRGPFWKDKTGLRRGRLVVTGWAGYGIYAGYRRAFWECRCDCGVQQVLCLATTRSCGCLQREVWARGRGQLGKRTTLALMVLGKGPLTLAQAAKRFHVKQRALYARMCRYPDEPQKWVGRPPRVKFRSSRKEIWDELRRSDGAVAPAPDRDRDPSC